MRFLARSHSHLVSAALALAATVGCSTLSGCCTDIITAPPTASVAESSSPLQLSASLTASDNAPVLGTSVNITWQTSGATTVEVQGEDLARTDAAGTHTVTTSQPTTYYLAAADGQGNVVNQSVTVNPVLNAAQLQAAHDEWMAGLQNAAASMGCNGQLLIQQPGEEPVELVAQAQTLNTDCIALLPTSVSGASLYLQGLASASATGSIMYLSDTPATGVFQTAISF